MFQIRCHVFCLVAREDDGLMTATIGRAVAVNCHADLTGSEHFFKFWFKEKQREIAISMYK